MLNETSNSLPHDGKLISASSLKKRTVIPFKNHSQFGQLVDILSRKNNHHAILDLNIPQPLYVAFIEAFIAHLSDANIPHYLQNSDCIYLDISTREYYFDDTLQSLKNMLDSSKKYLIIALPNLEWLLRNQIISLITHPKCRLLVLTNDTSKLKSVEQDFTLLSISPPSESDIQISLQHQCHELENFHHVIIPDELLSLCYTFAKRYLSTRYALEKTLLLLDSCAARIGMIEPSEHVPLKPILTQVTLLQVLSEWTGISASHLQLGRFNVNEFCQSMQQKVFGQENAITLLGHALQQSQTRLREQVGPFCNVLFVGPKNSGKKSTALAFTHYLFKQSNMLFYAQHLLPSANSIWEIKFHSHTAKELLPLEMIIKNRPYAVIYFENIEKTSPLMIEQLVEILSTGYLQDSHGIQHHFQQACFIFSTSIGSHRLIELAKTFEPNDDPHTVDLMQFVSRNVSQASTTPLHAPQEIVDELFPELSTQWPALCENLNIIPFFPLNRYAVENIVRVKLKILGKRLNTHYDVELGYAPEVIRYLSNEAMKQTITNIENPLQQLYVHIEQMVSSHSDRKNNGNQLFLQLNETGQVLRSEWLNSSTIRQHTP
ncbi:MAG TPA: AAA family ATPase [Gammaproteobacteria bacterium]|nr:AAA family ATPase [Gammaproteobacteria bacterium]